MGLAFGILVWPKNHCLEPLKSNDFLDLSFISYLHCLSSFLAFTSSFLTFILYLHFIPLFLHFLPSFLLHFFYLHFFIFYLHFLPLFHTFLTAVFSRFLRVFLHCRAMAPILWITSKIITSRTILRIFWHLPMNMPQDTLESRWDW